MGAILLILRPGRSKLALLAVALGASVAIGGALNIVQSVPGSTLAALQANRLLFSRITYFNVGLFGEMVAMAAPLLAAVLMARGHLRLSRWAVVGVAIALAASLISLFFTFSKSAYLAAAAGLLAVLLLGVRTWRQRGAVLLAASLMSSLLVPWPELVLSPVPGLAEAYRSVVVRSRRPEPLRFVEPIHALGPGLARGALLRDTGGPRDGHQQSAARHRPGPVQDRVRRPVQAARGPAGAGLGPLDVGRGGSRARLPGAVPPALSSTGRPGSRPGSSTAARRTRPHG